jgi:hypothetical protein
MGMSESKNPTVRSESHYSNFKSRSGMKGTQGGNYRETV